jgi:hypothetical protein
METSGGCVVAAVGQMFIRTANVTTASKWRPEGIVDYK